MLCQDSPSLWRTWQRELLDVGSVCRRPRCGYRRNDSQKRWNPKTTKSAFLQELRGAETQAKNLSSTRLCTCPFTSRLWLWFLASSTLYVPGTVFASNEKTKLSGNVFNRELQLVPSTTKISSVTPNPQCRMPRSLITREGPPKSMPRVWISTALLPRNRPFLTQPSTLRNGISTVNFDVIITISTRQVYGEQWFDISTCVQYST